MMKRNIVTLFLAFTFIIQAVSSDEWLRTRALKSKKKIHKEESRKKSSKMKVKKEVSQPVDADDFAVATTPTRYCRSNSDCSGHFDDKSNGCFLGRCVMCVPHDRTSFSTDCYCAKDGGGGNNFDVKMNNNGYLSGISSWPPRGQYLKRCRECKRRFIDDGLLHTRANCFRSSLGWMYLNEIYFTNDVWSNFGPEFYNDEIGRKNGCRVYQYDGVRACELRCGKHNGRQMHINYHPKYDRDTGIIAVHEKVHGLRIVAGDWVNGCVTCADNLERTGYIEGGWFCRERGIRGVYIENFKFKP